MSFVPKATDRAKVLLLGLLGCGSVQGQSQALCDVLLRPAFNYSTDGLALLVADSSTTYGLLANSSWDFGDGTGEGLTPQHLYEEPGTYDVCLTLTSTSLDCSSTYCRRITVPLDNCGGAVDAHFIWQFAGLNSAGIIDASVVAFSGERLWEFGDGGTSSEVAPAHTWSLPGPHFVTLTHTQGECTATYGEWVEVDGNAGTCGPDLFVDFTTQAVDQQVVFEPSIATTTFFPFASIWSYGDGSVDTTVFADHYYAMAGRYQTCLLVGAWGIQEQDTCFSLVCHTSEVVAVVGLDEHAAGALSIWPNPFVSGIRVSVPGAAGPMTVRLFDAFGRVVLQEGGSGSGVLYLDAPQLPEGAYIVEVVTRDNRYRRSVLKVRE